MLLLKSLHEFYMRLYKKHSISLPENDVIYSTFTRWFQNFKTCKKLILISALYYVIARVIMAFPFTSDLN